MIAGGIRATMLGLGALLTLAACDTPAPPPPPPTIPPVERPDRPAPAPAAPVVASPDSRALSIHYSRLQADLQARGLLRTDGGGPDTMFTDRMLADNFIQIALFDEFIATDQGLRAQATESSLRRWAQPVRFSVEFGETIPQDQRVRDRTAVGSYVSRLARVTGHPMRMSDDNPNFHVMFLNEPDRLDYAQRLRTLVPGIDDRSLRAFLEVPRDTLCLVLAFSTDGSPEYSQAVALIRGEHPDLMRLSCIHEELAQGLGLANDSPRARPSIFNDDEEFGLLTTHDELLLRMLYDDRFTPGMSAADARPIARVVAAEVMDSGPS